MSDSAQYVLVLEDLQLVSRLVSETLRRTIPGAEVMQAYSLAEARNLAREIEFDLLILDIQLPDGNGLDFLVEMQKAAPGVPAIFLTATRMPEYRDKARTLGAIRFMEKPVKVKVFSEVVKGLLQPETGEKPEMMFRGVLSHLTPMNLVQLKCLSNATVTLVFTVADGRTGKVHIREGEIIDAEHGGLRGSEAFYVIAGWQQGSVSESGLPGNCEQTIDHGWMSLLINAAQRIDEAPAQPVPAEPAPPATKSGADLFKSIRKK